MIDGCWELEVERLELHNEVSMLWSGYGVWDWGGRFGYNRIYNGNDDQSTKYKLVAQN